MLGKHLLVPISRVHLGLLRQAADEHIDAEIGFYGLPVIAGENFDIGVGMLLVKIAQSGDKPQAGKRIGQLQADAVVMGVGL